MITMINIENDFLELRELIGKYQDMINIYGKDIGEDLSARAKVEKAAEKVVTNKQYKLIDTYMILKVKKENGKYIVYMEIKPDESRGMIPAIAEFLNRRA
jgi:hypothetical protein